MYMALIRGNSQASSAEAISKEVLSGKLTIQSLVSERLCRFLVVCLSLLWQQHLGV